MNEHTESNREMLAKWLRILFYVHIASIAITAINTVSNLDTITAWISKALSVVAIWSMFQLKDVNPRYRQAAVFSAAVLVCGLLTTPISSSELGLSSILVLVGAIASCVATYQEYHAHSELVAEQDEKLAKKWNNLFGLEILVGLGVSLFSTVATLVLVSAEMDSGTVTTIILVVTNIINLLLAMLYLLYMNRTLKLFENGEE